jgi:hypothetical protein
LLFSDDCNHDVNGLYARSFEAEILALFPEGGGMPKLPRTHLLYRSFSGLTTGRRRRRTN